MSNFQTRLEMTIRGREFVLISPLCYKGNKQKWIVPAGFSTDLASTPWYLKWLIPGINEKREKAAILHDFFYRVSESGVSRKDADRVFLRAMIEDGAQVWRAGIMYAGVRLFGWMAYRKAGRE